MIKQILLISLALTCTCAGQTQPFPVRVLQQGPADTETELQIICLFSSDPANTLHGSLTELNSKLNGLLDRIRTPTLFRGELGETLLITPNAGALKANKLMLIGLGDSSTFTPERMELVGSIVYREASRLGVAHPFFAPTVLDGGVSKYPTGQISEQVMRGVLRAAATQKITGQDSASPQDLTFLAGSKNAASTRDGIEKSLAPPK